MQTDLFMEFASPPFAKGGVARAFEDGLALARAADKAGLGAVWLAEHHFLGDYSNAAAPDMLLAAMARETSRIGLGFAIIPLTLQDPVRVAERLATLDLLSKGRVMWGVGRGVTTTELDAFGIDPAQSRDVFLQRYAALRAILATGIAERGGKRLELRPPPAARLRDGWLACVSPHSIALAAELGLHAMTGPFKPWPLVKSDLARYRQLRPGGQTSFTLAVYCEADHAAARRRAAPGLVWAYRQILAISRPMLSRQLAGYEAYRRLGWLAPLLNKILSIATLEALGLAVVGDPAHVRKRLAALQDSGLDRVSLVIGGGDLEAAETIRCVELLAEQVLPALASETPAIIAAMPA
jgi:alkanesulfonate monooxygenase SsuD/methylene tetrahydromethanopterin reductase-like flavin-dependent oxidoreductase (luciferase family)